jgi:dolichol kinase
MRSPTLDSSLHVRSGILLLGAGLLALALPASRAHAGEITDLDWFSGVASVAGELIVAPPRAQQR